MLGLSGYSAECMLYKLKSTTFSADGKIGVAMVTYAYRCLVYRSNALHTQLAPSAVAYSSVHKKFFPASGPAWQ